MTKLEALHAELIGCRRCKRLVAWREEVAQVKRRAYREQEYWGRPVPGFGDPRAKLLVVGLAPGAHGANRTGRVFTGDRSGDFLYAGLHRAGFANQPQATGRDDGLKLKGAFVTVPVRCAPPDNKPTPIEIAKCQPWFDREWELLKPKAVLALGAIAWRAVLERLEWPRPWPDFAHGAEARAEGKPVLLGCYHVSQQNTQTGRLTEKMFDQVMQVARARLSEA
ncbi:MAG: uracil-DNA glycosylase [Myxococcaceae bacterium]